MLISLLNQLLSTTNKIWWLKKEKNKTKKQNKKKTNKQKQTNKSKNKTKHKQNPSVKVIFVEYP